MLRWNTKKRSLLAFTGKCRQLPDVLVTVRKLVIEESASKLHLVHFGQRTVSQIVSKSYHKRAMLLAFNLKYGALVRRTKGVLEKGRS